MTVEFLCEELMLECYGLGNQSLPKNIRDLNVAVSTT
jgi:hypothetical protein